MDYRGIELESFFSCAIEHADTLSIDREVIQYLSDAESGGPRGMLDKVVSSAACFIRKSRFCKFER